MCVCVYISYYIALCVCVCALVQTICSSYLKKKKGNIFKRREGRAPYIFLKEKVIRSLLSFFYKKEECSCLERESPNVGY